jgi:hypothetical protein
MAFDLSASRRDRVSAEAAFNAGGFILRSAVRELSRPLAQLRFNAAVQLGWPKRERKHRS